MRFHGRTTLITAGVLAGALLASTAWAQPVAPTRIRGKIASISPTSMTVTERNGASETITLDEPLTVGTFKKVKLASIADGSYIGTAARPDASGALQAQEVLVFPPEMKGTGEGFRPWDLTPDSTMTNGTVSGVVKGKVGRTLTVTYKDGSKTVNVPPNVPVVTLAPAKRSDLKVGAMVFLTASKNEAGAFHTNSVRVGTHGVNPPM
jgi:hypothetical protein